MSETSHADPAVTEPTGDTQPDTEANAVVDELDVHNGEPLRPTVIDGNGIERIAGPPVENWKPAQVDPTPEQIATNEAYHAREAARRDEATALLEQPTSEPLAAAQADYHDELSAAGDGSVTDVTPTEPTAPTPVTEPTSTPASPVPTPVSGQTDQQAVDAAAVADADANVAAQVEAERAQAAQAQEQADDAALAAAEAQQVADEEAQS